EEEEEERDPDDDTENRLPTPPLQQPTPPPNIVQLPQNPPNPFQAPFQNNFDASLINPPPRDPSFLRIPEITPPPITPPPITPPPITPPPPMMMQCFSGDTIVKIFNYEEKRLDEISLNDWILTAGDNKIGFSKVLSWLHKMPNETAEFLKFTLENGKSLKMTQKHFIYKTDCLANNITNFKSHHFLYEKIQAGNIQLSDCILFMNDDTKFIPTRISKIEKIQEKGIYAPLTDNGNIIANNIFASCYSEIDDELLQFTLPILNQYFNILIDTLTVFYDTIFQSRQTETDLIPGIQSFVQIVKTLL
uniref:Hint domain-containing protein n=1 Tax=Panagrolaimus sp. PS1159 TaxID=55785 RepID=A0AC35G261_9BILA